MPLFLSLFRLSSTHLFISKTPEQIKSFITNRDFWDLITFVRVFRSFFIKLCYLCIVNSITGLVHFNFVEVLL